WHATGFKAWLGADVRGRTLGILGMGRIGQAIARRAVGFGMPVIYHNRSPLPAADERACNARHVDKQQLLCESDFLVLALPLTAQTRHAVGAPELALMKPTAMLINVARGGIVDDAALAAAVRERRLAGAALDVFEDEPKVHPELLALDNVLLSPHIASATTETRRAMTSVAVENVLAILAERNFPVSELVPLASERSAGGKVKFAGKDITVQLLDTYDFADVDIAFFSAGGSVSREHAPRAAAAGAVVIDNTSEFRYQDDIPLVISEVNPHAIAQYTNRGIIANPNCS